MWDRDPIQAAPRPRRFSRSPRTPRRPGRSNCCCPRALVFSMLQVPGLLDEAIAALRPRLTGSLNFGVFMLLPEDITSYALIATFVLHLSSRAIWVAALGLRSVYPGGGLGQAVARPIYLQYAQRTTQH